MALPVSLPPHLEFEATLVAQKSYRVRDQRTGARQVLRICAGPPALMQGRIDALRDNASPQLVAERELLEAGGRLFTMRPWIEGRPVRLAEAELAPLVAFIAHALEPLHAARMAHGRIHAANLIRTAQGQLYLVDGADPVPGLDATGALHAAPEQLRGEAPAVRTDVYAAGLLAFEACTGRRPFAGAAWVELARRALYEGVALTFEEEARLDRRAAALLRQALALEPKARCGSLRELAEGLLPPAASPTPARAPALTAPRPTPPTQPLSPRLSARLSAALSLAGAAAAALLLMTGGGLEHEVAHLIQQNDYQQASDLLATARQEGEDPALVEKLEGDLDCAKGEQTACLAHYASALDQDADLGSDDTLRANTLAAFEQADRSWLVARVAAKLEGVDDDLLRHTADMRYWIRWNAVRALEERGLQERIPYGVVYGLDVLHAGTCSTRQRSLRKLVQAGDVGARPYLRQARAKADEKLFGDWCLGSDLDDAIRHLDAQR